MLEPACWRRREHCTGHLRFADAGRRVAGATDRTPLAELERRHIERVLDAEKGTRAAAERSLPLSSLYQHLKISASTPGYRS